MDLHKLANMPGFGSADVELRKLGHPRNPNDHGDKFKVAVEWSVGYRDVVEVCAFNEVEARQKAEALVRDCPELGTPDCVEIYSLRLLK